MRAGPGDVFVHNVGGRLRRSFILIVATIVAFALLWYASLRAAAVTRGGVNVVAKAAFLIVTCLACIAIGFFLPMAPVISALIGSAFSPPLWVVLLLWSLAGAGEAYQLAAAAAFVQNLTPSARARA